MYLSSDLYRFFNLVKEIYSNYSKYMYNVAVDVGVVVVPIEVVRDKFRASTLARPELYVINMFRMFGVDAVKAKNKLYIFASKDELEQIMAKLAKAMMEGGSSGDKGS